MCAFDENVIWFLLREYGLWDMTTFDDCIPYIQSPAQFIFVSVEVLEIHDSYTLFGAIFRAPNAHWSWNFQLNVDKVFT